MRLTTVRQADGTTRAGRVEGDEIVLLPFADVGALLASGDDWRERGGSAGSAVSCADAEIARLIPNPPKVVCVGRNYADHIREGRPDAELPRFPELFAKFGAALVGPYEDIVLPTLGAAPSFADSRSAIAAAVDLPMTDQSTTSDCVDWEAELVIVIGRSVRAASAAEAEAAIAGFTVGNDVSVRDWQLRTSQWLQGKTFEGLSPVGPVLATPDEVGGVRPDLPIRCLVDDEVMQDSKTGGMIFDTVELVSYFSRIVTLHPGDLIFAGTVAGVGTVRKPPVFLRPGQVLTTEIEGIGATVNRLVADRASGDVR